MVKKRTIVMGGQVILAALLIFIGLISTQKVSYGQTIPTVTPTLTVTQTLTVTPTATLKATPTLKPTATVTDTPPPQLNKWSEPYAFERPGWFPDITSDSSGRVYAAWSNSVIYAVSGPGVRMGYDVVLYSTSADGNNWGPINEVAALRQSNPGSVEVTRPDMLVDKNGILHMTFRDINIHYSQSPVVLAENARFWTKMVQVNVNRLGYFSRLATDSQGRMYVVYTEDVPSSDCLICYHLFIRTSDDHGLTWGREIDISTLPTGSAKPHILIDKKDYIHVVWEAGRGGTLGQLTDPTQAMYVVSYNRGESWAPPIEVVVPDAINSKNITIGEDGFGNLVIVWWNLPEDVPYFQVSQDSGLSWTRPERIPNVWGIWANYNSRLDDYSMATDSAGNLHLAMVGRLNETDTALRVLHISWNGLSWSAPEAIVSYAEDAPEWPVINVSNGNQLNVVWYVRGKNYIWAAAPDFYKVLYSYSRINAPQLGSTPWPTIIPPTATPKITETPVPSATLISGPRLEGTVIVDNTDNAVISEVDQLLVAARSVIPAAGAVIILFVLIIILRRR